MRQKSNPICPVCSSESVEVTGKEIYPRRADLHGLKFYRCPEHPDYYVGCHKTTGEPLGILAGKDHRKLKMMCHEMFDPFWRVRGFNRGDLYERLSKDMGIPIEETHFGMMSEERLRSAYLVLSKWCNSER